MGSSYSVADIPSLEGKVAIITGASAGIGKICAKEMARKGCHVILACRSKDKTLPVVEEIQKETKNDKVEFMELDLAELQSVDRFVKEYKEKGLPIHILLNNAAVMACPYKLSPNGIELQFATNHLGHFRLTTELLEVIIASAPSRIVNVSSAAHNMTLPKNGIAFDGINDEAIYDPWKMYGQSKLANVLFTNELAKRLKDKHVYCNSLHPGVIATELSRNMTEVYGWLGTVADGAISVFAKSPMTGSLTSLYLSTSPTVEKEEITGCYYVPTAKLSKASAYGRNEELAAKLWEFSEKLIEEKLGAKAEEGDKDEGKGKEHEEEKGEEGGEGEKPASD